MKYQMGLDIKTKIEFLLYTPNRDWHAVRVYVALQFKKACNSETRKS